MPRGTIYYIITNENEISGKETIGFRESDYCEQLKAFNIDYVEEEHGSMAEVSIVSLRDTLTELGANITEPRACFGFSFWFDKVEAMQQQYFKPKLEKLKAIVDNLDLFGVIRSAPDLNSILNDTYGDLITFNSQNMTATYTMPDFIRLVKPGTVYHVYEKTFLIH